MFAPNKMHVIYAHDTIGFHQFPQAYAPILSVKKIHDTVWVRKKVGSWAELTIGFSLPLNHKNEPYTFLKISDSAVFFSEAVKFPVQYLYLKEWSVSEYTGFYVFAHVLQNQQNWSIEALDSMFNAPQVLPLHAVFTRQKLEQIFSNASVSASQYVKFLIAYGFRVLTEKQEPIRAMDIGYYATKMYSKMPEGHRLMAFVYKHLGFKDEASLKYKTFLKLMQEEGRLQEISEQERVMFEP